MEEAEITVPLPVIQPLFDGALGDMKGCQELKWVFNLIHLYMY
jgi:hypothetical protein